MRLPNKKIAKLNKYLKPLNDYLILYFSMNGANCQIYYINI